MPRKGLSVLFLILLVIALAACRRAADPSLPTPIAGLPTSAATAVPATTEAMPVFATATSETPPQTSSPTPTPVSSATAGPTNPTAAPPTATATPPPPTAVPPTAPPNTSPPPGGSARIVFGPGATSAVVQSNLVANGDTDTWILRVMAGQVVTVQTIATVPGRINVQLGDMNGGVLVSNPDTVGISIAVPITGDYQISFSTASGAPAVGYTAQVFIPAAGGPVTPTRIQFAPGASSAQLNDSLAAGGDLNPYVVNVGAGQTINVAVFASVPAVTNIYIRNSAGQLITAGTDMSGASVMAAAAGDYYIDVSNFNAAPAVSYTLTVTVPPITQPPTQPAPGQPTRIEFGPGQTSASFDGQVVAGGQGRQYVIRMLAGQTLITNLNDNPVANVDITITDATGRTLNFGRAPTELGTRIPANGDYTITLSTASATPVNYSLTVIAPPLPNAGAATRITFPAGSTTTTVSGGLPSGGSTETWVIRALAGQTLNVYLGASQAGWMMGYVYKTAGDILALGSDMDVLSAPLAANDDYFIVLVSDAGAGPITYSMVVEIP